MSLPFDSRPTLASWPKRIYAWEELPAPFRPALEGWRDLGMPPGNVTYIPRVAQSGGGPEYAAAWWDGQVCIQTGGSHGVQVCRIAPGEVRMLTYQLQLLRCAVDLELRGDRRLSFSYNVVKEDQLRPVLNLLLGNPPEAPFPTVHPSTPDLDRLLEDSYAMYHTSRLCYRFGAPLLDFLWLRGRARRLFQKADPEYLVGVLDRGLAVIITDPYGTQTAYLRWEDVARVSADPAGRKGRVLQVAPRQGAALEIPLLPGQESEASAFLSRIKTAGHLREVYWD